MKIRINSTVLIITSIFMILIPCIPVVLAKPVETEMISMHLQAEGMDLWDPIYNAFIKVKYEYNPTLVQPTPTPPIVVGPLEKAMFKKYTVDPTTNEEIVLFLGKLKEGAVVYLGDDWVDPNTNYLWHHVWYFIGYGEVKTLTTTYPTATIEIIFCLGELWAWAKFTAGDIQGPPNPGSLPNRPGMITILTKY